MTTFTSIPIELLHLTAFYLEYRDCAKLKLTCRRLNSVLSEKFGESYGLQYLTTDKTRLPKNVLKEFHDLEIFGASRLYCEHIGKRGYDKYLTKIMDQLTANDIEYVLEDASSAGHLDIVQLVRSAKDGYQKAFKLAAGNGHVNVMKYLHENNTNNNINYGNTFAYFIGKNQIDICKNILNVIGSMTINMICQKVTNIAQKGLINTIEFILNNNIETCCMGMRDALLRGAAVSDRMDLV